MPFGFHGRPYSNEEDYKYVADSAYVELQNISAWEFNSNSKVEIIKKDGSKIPYKNIIFQDYKNRFTYNPNTNIYNNV